MKKALALLASSLLVFAASGCVAVAAGAGAGYLVHREVSDGDVHTAQVQADVDDVWATVRETLEIDADLDHEVELAEFPRTARTRIDGANVSVAVEAYDLDRTVVKVRAARYDLASDSALAERTLNRILHRLRE